jgi:hypothetical protein
MGTSSDRTSGRGGAWTPLKRAATAYARSAAGGDGGSEIRAARILGRHVAVLGGAGAAAATATAGRSSFARLGGLLAGISGAGLGPTLEDRGLQSLVGADPFDILDELCTLVAGDGSEVEQWAARDAVADVITALYANAESWEDLESTPVAEDRLIELLRLYLARYVYNRLPVLAERLARLTDPRAVRDADEQMVRMIEALIEIHFPDNPLTFDWSGPDGDTFAEETMRRVYDVIETLDDES